MHKKKLTRHCSNCCKRKIYIVHPTKSQTTQAVELRNALRAENCFGIGCCQCPLSRANNGVSLDCLDYMKKYPKQALKIMKVLIAEYNISKRTNND